MWLGSNCMMDTRCAVTCVGNTLSCRRLRHRQSPGMRSTTRIELKVISVKHFKEEAAEFVKCIAKVEFRGES